MSKSAPKATFAFVTLGCAKNLVDSERMLGLLAADGYALLPDPDGADVVVVNTCGFIEPARQESVGVIREMIDLKRRGRIKGLVVAGCLAERRKDALLEELPEIDQVVGVFGREEITRVCDRLLGRLGEQRTLFRPAPIKAQDDGARLRITPRHFAYLKISEGCDRLCTFCAIPSMRGPHVTKPIEQVVAEAEELVRDGVRELILVAQDTTYYGRDLYGELRLAELIRKLDRVQGLDWIRILYTYPVNFTDELIDVLAGSEKVLPYLDLPLQHINDRILKRMKRLVTRGQTEDLIARLRAEIPGLVLRTTFIVGFPGETEAEFDELADFVRRAKFERLGVFEYSFEPGTPATRLPDHLPNEVKAERRARIMKIQQQVAFDWAAAQVGRRLDVLIDAPVSDDHPLVAANGRPAAGARSGGSRRRSSARAPTAWWMGRCYADAPDIDALVFVSDANLRTGDLVSVTVDDARGYDLIGCVDREKS